MRYRGNLDRYRARGGLVRLGTDVRGFIHVQDGNRTDMARFSLLLPGRGPDPQGGAWGILRNWACIGAILQSFLLPQHDGLAVRLYLLDTFEGFPERDLTGIDADKPMGSR